MPGLITWHQAICPPLGAAGNTDHQNITRALTATIINYLNITNPGAECDKCHVSRVLAPPSHRLYRGRSREMILHRKRFHGLLTRDGIMMVLWWYCDGIVMVYR